MSAYVASLQAALACITGDVVRASGYRPDAPSLSVLLAGGAVVALRGTMPSLGFRLRQYYRLVEDRKAPSRRRWRVELVDYSYTFVHRESEHELLAFHWHPHVAEKPFPHVHLETGLELRRDLVGIHLPTGSLPIEDVVRFAIEELGVRPRVPDWTAVLERTRASRAE